MPEEQTGQDLTAEFHRLLLAEPAFRTDLGEALRAAERDGLRRRNRTRTLRSGAAAALAVAAATVLVVSWPSRPRASAPPAVVVPTQVSAAPVPTVVVFPSPTGATPAPTRSTPRARVVAPMSPAVPTATTVRVTPSPRSSATSSPGTMARLERLVRQLAAPSGGEVTLTVRDAVARSVTASVTTDQGTFEVSAYLETDPDGVAAAREMCRTDGSSCTEQWSTGSAGVWSRVYPNQAGREGLTLVASYPQAPTLNIGFTNYVEQPEGLKSVGPGWKEAGVTVARLRQAETDAGLDVVRTSPGS
jgi:hypothetical protein